MSESINAPELIFHPLRDGKTLVKKMDDLLPKMESLLEVIQELKDSLSNGKWSLASLEDRIEEDLTLLD